MPDRKPKPEEIIFDAAVQIEKRPERDAYVKNACGADEELLAGVQALLRHHDVGAFLDIPIFEEDVAPDVASPISGGPGTIIGRYKLLEKIGEGGMAVVYMAEQERPIRRKVALKIIKLGMDTKQVVARFEAERQALAMMDHPNIAKVHDAGATETGRPYFVMELVAGLSITKHCDQNELSTRERLTLFLQVCSAIQHAHQKGIIHRDIKPSNVMVTTQDGRPVPKVIDFGIAKATNQKLTEKTLFTRYAQIVGTPVYMSPEQAGLSDLDIDTRTDIYSLGVLLYELLIGTTPFSEEELRRVGYLEMQRMIREEEPPRPSTKLTTLGQTLNEVARRRAMAPAVLRKAIQGELDWIVMKSLEKDRARRYETANALGMDLLRHLSDEPIAAGPPSTKYKLYKLGRRNWRVLVTAGVVAFALALGMGLATWQAIRATQAMRVEARERLRADQQRQEAVGHLYHSLVGEARAIRLSRTTGYRWEAWDRLSKALELDTPEQDLKVIRLEAVRCMGDLLGAGPVIWDDFSAPVLSLAGCPQARIIAVGLADGDISLRDLETGEEVTRLLSERAASFSSSPTWLSPSLPMAWIPNSMTLVAAQGEGTLSTWETQDGNTWTANHVPVAGRIIHVSVEPDGGIFAVYITAVPGEVRVWSSTGGTTGASRLQVPGKVIRCAAVCLEKNLLAVGFLGYEGKPSILVWNVKTGEAATTLTPERGYVRDAGFSSDGSRLFCACDDGVVVYNTANFQATWSAPDFSQVAAISPENSHIAFSSRQLNSLRFWSIAGNQKVATLEHSGPLTDVTFTDDGYTLVTATRDRVYVWSMNTPERRTLIGHTGRVGDMAFSPDGRWLASASGDQILRIWDPSLGKLLRQWDLFDATVAFSPHGRLLAVGGRSEFIRVFETDSWMVLCDLELGPQTVRGPLVEVAFSSDGNYLAASGTGAGIWRLVPDGDEPFEFVQQLSTTVFNRHICFSPDSRLLAWAEGFKSSRIHVWDMAQAQELPAPESRVFSSIESLAFFPDSRRLIFFDENRSIEVWDVIERKRDMVLPDEPRDEASGGTYNNHLSLSPDGRWFAASSFSGRAANIWDTHRRELMLSLPEQDSTVTNLNWSPDNNLLAVGRSDGTLALWSLASIRAQLKQLSLDW